MRVKTALLVLGALVIAAACASKPEDKAKEMYFKGVDLVKEKKIAEAIVVYKQVRDRYPATEWGQKAKKELVFYEDVVQIDQYSEQRTIKTDFREISRACELYRVRANTYPDTISALMPEYLKKVMKDPWGRSYYYTVENRGGRSTIVLACFGEDEIPGGEGDAMDVILEGERFTAGADVGEPGAVGGST